MDKMKIGLIVFNVICLAFFVFVVVWSITNWNTIKSSFDGTKLYTQSALDEAYKQGLGDKEKYEQRINDYKTQIETLNKSIKELTDENTILKNNNKDYAKLIEELQAKVKELQNKVKYYESLLSAYENVNKLIATFMYNDEVYLVQLYESGSKVSIQAPQDTDHITFEGWLVNGQEVDLETYTITENTTFVAKLTYHQIVTYKDSDTVLKTQKVKKADVLDTQGYLAPTKSYYNFAEWQLNGESIASGYVVNDDIVLTAKYEYALNGQYVYYVGVTGIQLEGVFTISDTTIENVISRKNGKQNTLITFALNDNKINATIDVTGDGKRHSNIVFEPMLDSANNITAIKQTITAGDVYVDHRYCYKCDEDLSQNYINIFVDGKLTKSILKSEMAQKLSANYADKYVPTITLANGDTVALNFTKVQDSYFVFINKIDEDGFGYSHYYYTMAGWGAVPISNNAKTSITVQFKNATSQVIDNSVKYEYQI